MIKAYKLLCGADGHSYVQEGRIEEGIITKAHHIHFMETAANASYDWHTAPQTQYVLTLRGTLEFTTSLGQTFTLRTGEVLVATDTNGFGHKWKLVGSDPWIRAYIVFDPTVEINFTAET